jgi:hypothetical protein
MVYSTVVADTPTRPLYRCISGVGGTHFFSTDRACEGKGSMDTLIGHIAASRGREMLRGLYRCKHKLLPNAHMHSLDLQCDDPDGDGSPLGYVR